jgi:hypothetical protein
MTSDENKSCSGQFRLLAVALEYPLTGGTQSLPVPSQALLNRRIIAQ